jgi:GTP cyclohydrolase IA
MSEAARAEAEIRLEKAYRSILDVVGTLGYPVSTDDNFSETSGRAARAMLEVIRPLDEITAEVEHMLSRTFPARYDEMVISKHNITFGVCPHHLLPVIYRISVAYIPTAKLLGIY